MYVRQNAARQRKIAWKELFFVPNVGISLTIHEMNYHVAKKHAPSISKQSMVCSPCEQEFSSYYSLQQHRRKEHGVKQRNPNDTIATQRGV